MGKKRGRPEGYKLSENSKDKIRQKRLGTHHSRETKNKISKSLKDYFRKKDPLSQIIEQEYSDISEEAVDWVCENRKELDDENNDFVSDKRLTHIRQLEISFGTDLENIFGHGTTPEFILLLREELESKGAFVDLQELQSIL
jgi:hypothetical protein